MSNVPENKQTFSLLLSETLDEIGVNEEIVLKRRKSGLLQESLQNLTFHLKDENSTAYYCGGQTEGTTTLGLNSDKDTLFAINTFNVIQDWSDWEPGVYNLLMIQDDNVSPGYCLLQWLRNDAPLPLEINGELPEYTFRDRRGRILLKNTIINAGNHEGHERNGPAFTLQGIHDIVIAFPCKSWPAQATQWFNIQRRNWPTEKMKTYCRHTRCFVVAVGRKGSNMEELEWRISTSEAERCLMFSLNITQIRCYVLMKMLMKTFITSKFPDSISSFMCKTVLFHCIAHTHAQTWRENNFLTCLNFCLTELYNCVTNEECKHFIIHENNLMYRRISPDIKPTILNKLLFVINNNGRALLEIQCDSLGCLLLQKFGGFGVRIKYDMSLLISGQLMMNTALTLSDTQTAILKRTNNNNIETVLHLLKRKILKLKLIYNSGDKFVQTASSLLASRLSTTLGSVLASFNIYHSNSITLETHNWLSLGLNSDVSSCKLKEASIFYCIGDTEATRRALNYTEQRYDVSKVEPVCSCHDFLRDTRRIDLIIETFQQNVGQIQHNTAACVIFLPCEINCCPHELKYEMFRSTREDRAYRCLSDFWMDWAVVDSLPYLNFLQYKNYLNLGQHERKQQALANLSRIIDEEPNLGHRETALNLLGQCMEQEGRVQEALQCYIRSKNIQDRNRGNAANLHICILLAKMMRNT